MNTIATVRRAVQFIAYSPRGILQTLLTATLILLLFHHPSPWYLRIPVLCGGILGLMLPHLVRNLYFWFILASFQIVGLYHDWDTSDNHKYLIAYWCLSLSIAFGLHGRFRMPYLRNTSRWLIACCMLLACGWKICSATYLDGSFFHWTLLEDGRFEWVTETLGGVTSDQMADNSDAIDWLDDGHFDGIDLPVASLATTDTVRTIATALTWWTVAVEAIVGVLFLVACLWSPKELSKHPSRFGLRNVALLFFAISTYSIATVKGFGWILMILGYAQTEENESRARIGYLAVFILLQLYKLPYLEALSAIAR